MLKLFTGLAILILALVIQFIFAFAGWHFMLSLAVLIAFASAFDFWELILFDFVAVFLLNWQPSPSVALIAFFLVPLAAYLFRHAVHSEAWIGNLIAIFVGFAIFYLAAAPTLFFHDLVHFFVDVIIGLVVGEMALFALR